jgi:hypothetical protein
MSTTTISKVQNYQGGNNFINQMKEVIRKWGQLTPKQAEAAEKILANVVTVNVETLPENLKRIATYDGLNFYLRDVKSKLLTYGTLSEKQVDVATKQLEKEFDKEKTFKLNIPTVGETIKIGRAIGQNLKEKYNLKFNPILLDITKVLAISPKAVKFSAKLTIKRGDVCMCCARTLTDEFSMLTKMGKICAEHIGMEYITDASQAERFRNEYLKRVDEIGEMELWVPKRKIILWNGRTEAILKMI